MTKYIDAEKLKAEIERRRLQNRYIDTDGYEQELFELIDSLQQEQQEVDLEKEMEKFGERWPYPASFDGYDKDWVDELTEECAKHFYELGKNSK